jgi:hypothetical protein
MHRLVLLTTSPQGSAATLARMLTSLRQALAAHAAKLLPSATLVEVGCNNSPEQLNQGFDVAAVVSASADSALSLDTVRSLALQFQNVRAAADSQHSTASTRVLSLLFAAAPSPHCSTLSPVTPSAIRHFVAWKFRPDAAPGAIDTAVAGYLNLPRDLPYFSSLEVGPDTSHNASYSVCLYSTFHDAQAQHGFVRDPRRLAFKDAFVRPHLADNGVLVFDFVPARD